MSPEFKKGEKVRIICDCEYPKAGFQGKTGEIIATIPPKEGVLLNRISVRIDTGPVINFLPNHLAHLQVEFTEEIDKSWIAKFPRDFLQKGIDHLRKYPDETFFLSIGDSRVFIRRAKARVCGVRPKSPINGRIVTWAFCNLYNLYSGL